jgi:hypothetical protein
MLRQLEYEADIVAVNGKTGIDTAWLREQLNMQAISPTKASTRRSLGPHRQGIQ